VSFRRLVIRGLRHYWRTGAVVIFALAVATGVIVGSLVIGDSVTGSIARSALLRLGSIHYALTAPDWFREELAGDLGPAATSVALLSGAARNPATDAVVPKVTAVGVDDSFWALYPGATPPSLSGREVAINASLAHDAGLSPGDSLLLTVRQGTDVPADSLFANREREDNLAAVRLTVKLILPDEGVGSFRLDPQAATPRNIFVSRDWLAAQLDRSGHANAIVVGAREVPGSLQSSLSDACELADYGLEIVASEGGYLSLRSDAIVLADAEVQAARAAATDLGARADAISVYLADGIRRANADADSGLSYAVIAGVERLSPVQIVDGQVRDLSEGIVLNRWAADDLDASLGEMLTLTWLVPSWESGYDTDTMDLPLVGVIGTAGMGADADLTPDFEGITDADNLDDWDPPFPVDMDRVTDRDDEYWDHHRAAPKAFVSLETARAMWSGAGAGEASDWITSVRFEPGPNATLATLEKRLPAALLARLSPADEGLVFRPVRADALDASQGTSDFSQLFLSMSFFLVLSGAGLAAMLMRLSADRRASQVGVMMASGFTARNAARALLLEGAALAIPGALLGVPLGVLYAREIIQALGSRWQDALGAAPQLWLFVEPTTLLQGALAGLAVGMLSAWWSARKLGRARVLDLLGGWLALQTVSRGRPRGPLMLIITGMILLVILLLLLSLAGKVIAPEVAFFGIGAALMVAGMCLASLGLGRAMRLREAARSKSGLALRSAAAGRGRSLLVVGLIAAATFVIVAVAANSRDFSDLDVTSKSSGAGGFALVATSSIPLPWDFGTAEGRAALGFSPEDEAVFTGVETISFLASPGEDISCLNVARPHHPRVLGVSDRMIARGGFPLSASGMERGENPWTALIPTDSEGALPAFGDVASVRWQLHSGPGQVYTLPDESGRPADLRFAGQFTGSLFQSEILVHESALGELFPSVDAPSYFLIACPPDRADQVAAALRRNLGDAGLEVRTTAEVLNDYIAVQNTYLSMFLALGGLGLILGSVGLVAVLLRSALERRGEFALMLATGFRRTDLARLLALEHVGLLLAGLVLGTLAALIAVAPQLASSVASVNWTTLAGVLMGILIVGLLACVMSAAAATRGNLIEALREE
jgi:ABC-type lipoprotein release transport system permease subunit